MADLGLSQAELARRLNDECAVLTGRQGCLTDRDVRRYLEGGTAWPHARQRLCLERVFGRPATELGFSQVSRARGASGADAVDSWPADARLPARLGMSDVRRLHGEYVRILQDDWRVGGARRVENDAVELSMRIQSTLSSGTASTRVRQSLYSLASDVISTAAFAAIDAKVRARARRHLDRAVTLAGLSGDSETQYHVWNHLAMAAGQRRDHVEEMAAAETMKGLWVARRDPLCASLAHMRHAKALARSDRRTEALRSLAAAEKSFHRAGDDGRPVWINFYDQSELAGLSASIWFSVGNFERAECHFHQALSGIRPELVRNRALYTAHLALAQASQGEMELACATSQGAYDLLTADSGSKRTLDILSKARTLVAVAGTRAPEVISWLERSRQWK
ncbi:XRE family transcriptional regulator [Streptomyces sp. NPDC048290]|uniref:XRE family transcriptional regulator n=1 Tax=Streptomyces sp. NPDC048290 TaxID=3155811 RepID=UPI0034278127